MEKNLLTFILILFLSISVLNAADVAKPTSLKIGISADLSGVNKIVGQHAKEGVVVYFNKINAGGGIFGHPLELIALDDQYNPELASRNVRDLIEHYKVIALVGNLGIANVLISLPILTEKKTLLFGPITGFALTTPPQKYLFNVMTNYEQLHYLIFSKLFTNGYTPNNLAFFMQHSGSGEVIYKSAIAALHKLGYANIPSLPLGVYNPSTLDVENALAQILDVISLKQPSVIMLAGISVANEKFIKIAAQQLPNAIFVTETSLIPSKNLDKTAEGRVILAQAIPRFDSDLPLAKEYREDCKKYGNIKPSDVGFSNYISAKLFVLGLAKAAATGNFTSDGIINALETMGNLDIGVGVIVNFSKTNHQAFAKEWSLIYKNGKYTSINWEQLKSHPSKALKP